MPLAIRGPLVQAMSKGPLGPMTRGEFSKLLAETAEECNNGVALVLKTGFRLVAQKLE